MGKHKEKRGVASFFYAFLHNKGKFVETVRTVSLVATIFAIVVSAPITDGNGRKIVQFSALFT